MGYDPNISYYTNSNYIRAVFSEGNSDDTILDYISRENWSDNELFESNMESYPSDRYDKYHPVPDYFVYEKITEYEDSIWYDKGDVTAELDALLNPNDPRVPTNFELLYQSDEKQIVVYKIHNIEN